MLETVFSPLYNSNTEITLPVFLLIMAFALLLGAVYFAVTGHVMKKKLNLE